jgi:G3E family GTPase
LDHVLKEQRPIVDVLTGFLGSGKTTLLNKLLRDRAFTNTAVIVNELGEIGIDHLLVEERTDGIALLEGGCLCCAVVESLPETLLDLCTRRAGGDVPAFDRILIETTGLADPAPIAEVIRRSPLLTRFLAFGLVVTTVDAVFGQAQLDEHWEALAQVVMADRLILTKLDLIAVDSLDLRERLAALNPVAEIVASATIAGDPSRLVAPLITAAHRSPAAMPEHHNHNVHTFSLEIAALVTTAGLAAWTQVVAQRFGAKLLRCKGFVKTLSRPVLIQGVRGRFEIQPLPPDTRDYPAALVFIVQGLERADILPTLEWLHAPEGSHPPNPKEQFR